MTDGTTVPDPGAAPGLLDVTGVDAAPGRPWALQWTQRVDEALAQNLVAFQATAPRRAGGVALVALGSYARRSLCPQSDIDLMLVHDGWSSTHLEELVRAICYPLWDAGLSVGHAVRTTKEAVRSADERVDTATALTERRLIAGSVGLSEDLAARISRWLRRNTGRFAEEIRAADAERHARDGGTPGALEPDLKDGTGGLRDLHSLRWAGAILLGESGLDPLVGARYLGADDRALLADAGERLLAARCALHLVGGKHVKNTLRLDLQDEVAERLGMADGDVLLRDVGLATRTIAHLHTRTWPVLLRDATRGRRRRRPVPESVGDDLVIIDGLVEVDAAVSLAAHPDVGMRAVGVAAEHGTVLGRHTAMRLRREVDAIGQLPWNDPTRDSLLQLLRAGRDGLAAIGDADHLGLWDALLPEWHRVRGRPQRNPLHTFDVDTHGNHAAAWMADIAQGSIDPRHAEIFAAMQDGDGLLLGTWLHDVGKAWPGDHSISGATVGREWVSGMGFGEERADQIGQLILHHLLLPDVATQRDIDDPAEIDRVAAAIGDVETLDGLYLLAFADSRATGKAAWSDWKDLLIRRLYERVRQVLDGDGNPMGNRTPAILIRAAAGMGGDPDRMRELVEALPRRYVRSASPEQVKAHTQLLAGRTDPDQLVANVRPGPVGSTVILSIVAADRHALFSDIVGVLAAHRIEVLQAHVFTDDDGRALDWLVTQPSAGLDWEVVIDDLTRAQAGELAVTSAVERRERARDVRPPNLAYPVAVRIRTSAGDQANVTRVEVHGPDSPGVLFRVSRALADLGTELLSARVATLGPEVRDTFFLFGEVPSLDRLRDALEPALLDTPAVA